MGYAVIFWLLLSPESHLESSLNLNYPEIASVIHYLDPLPPLTCFGLTFLVLFFFFCFVLFFFRITFKEQKRKENLKEKSGNEFPFRIWKWSQM